MSVPPPSAAANGAAPIHAETHGPSGPVPRVTDAGRRKALVASIAVVSLGLVAVLCWGLLALRTPAAKDLLRELRHIVELTARHEELSAEARSSFLALHPEEASRIVLRPWPPYRPGTIRELTGSLAAEFISCAQTHEDKKPDHPRYVCDLHVRVEAGQQHFELQVSFTDDPIAHIYFVRTRPGATDYMGHIQSVPLYNWFLRNDIGLRAPPRHQSPLEDGVRGR